MRHRYKFLARAVCAVTMFGWSMAHADTLGQPPREMSFTVDSLDQHGAIVSKTGEKFRIFGIVPQPGFSAYLKAHLLGTELHCDYAGATGTRRALAVDDAVRSIDCNPTIYHRDDSTLTKHFSSLQGELIHAGVALEYCTESRNHFETCPAEQE